MNFKYYFIILNILIIIQFLVSVLIANDFVYAIDDPYIHLAVAKNLYFNNIWGAVWGQFSGTSSSILFTLLNWFLYILLPNSISEYFPLILNMIAANLLLNFLIHFGEEFNFSKSLHIVFFLILLIYLPLLANILNGMEHLWHILFLGYYLLFLIRILQGNENSILLFYITTFLLTSARYEGLFIVASGFLILSLNKKYKVATLQLFVALLPITIYGLYSITQGGYFLPNTLLAKGKSLEIGISAFPILLDRFFSVLVVKKQIIPSIIIIIFSLYYFIKSKNRLYFHITIFIGFIFIQHIVFADFGWFFRYEAYLIFTSGLLLLFVLNDLQQNNKLGKLVIILTLLLSLPLIYRFIISIERTNLSGKYHKDVHIAYAEFVDKNFNSNEMIMAGDIGTLCFFLRNPLLDVNGLATSEITEAIRNGYQSSNFLDSVAAANKVDVAILYKTWEGNLLSNKWKLIGYWYGYNPTGRVNAYMGLYTTNQSKYFKLKQQFDSQSK